MYTLKTFLIWMTMWACDIVPGVSGWTIAFISGIYQKLLTSIRSCFDIQTFKLLFSWRFVHLRDKINWNFLLTLFWWIIVSILLLSWILEQLIESHPHMVWWVFWWLIVSSILVLVKKEAQKWIWIQQVLFLCAWIALAYSVWLLAPTQVTAHRWIVIGSGMIAISAMILPWLSGSYLLLILWMYSNVLWAINEKDIVFLLLFIVWIVLWLAGFVRVVSYFLNNHHTNTIAMLIGIMIWALPILRPRQNPDTIIIKKSGEEKVVTTELVSPKNYNKNSDTSRVILLFLLSLIWSFHIFSSIDQDLNMK